ncbi:silent information regulator family protein [Naegleria gruberi]|uniref:protein acetyllysine N-acetyltransferase n=1 Tax=Naegleria gruberi TaxID=5762 RepID=D2VDJ0_NAEGR|nr:silent information regulator family protein [Naegleria gruberi]EFC45242.1 silent information regulator family protein [Naegleria gruberi]|eukprot:XP_002677986.1 silent information regulator family protein [Naegleria gruberi strain NEG-M]
MPKQSKKKSKSSSQTTSEKASEPAKPKELPASLKEHEESETSIKRKVKKLANYLKEAKHVVIYTGAGISTSAQLSDYRGPKGVWTAMEYGVEEYEGVEIEQAVPTYCHYAITHLVKKDYVKYVVSTNVDGLHRRSGLPRDKLAELHGNCYVEYCNKCEKEYLRGFDVSKNEKDWTKHFTGRKCECGGRLKDNIIHFDEDLPEKDFDQAMDHSKKGDFALVLGTSMKVTPSCEFPLEVLDNKGMMCIVNLQKTEYDRLATVRIFGKTDLFMQLLMKELEEEENVDTSFDALQVINID